MKKFVNGEYVDVGPDDFPPVLVTADDYRRAIQTHLDTAAQSRNYDSGTTIATYVNSTNPAWAAEAQAFVAWRDAVWAYAYVELDKVTTGARPQPSVEELVAELPEIDWVMDRPNSTPDVAYWVGHEAFDEHGNSIGIRGERGPGPSPHGERSAD